MTATAADILIKASHLVGSIHRVGGARRKQTMVGAICELCPGDVQNVVTIFNFLRAETRADNLIEWEKGKGISEIAHVMRQAARRATQ